MKKIIFFSIFAFLIIPLSSRALVCSDITKENNEYFSESGFTERDLACKYNSYGPANDRKHIEIYYVMNAQQVDGFAAEYFMFEVSDSDNVESHKKYHVIYCGSVIDYYIQTTLPYSITSNPNWNEEFGAGMYSYKVGASWQGGDGRTEEGTSALGILTQVSKIDGEYRHNCYTYAGVKYKPELNDNLFAFSDFDLGTYGIGDPFSEDDSCEDGKCPEGQDSNMGMINLSANNFAAMGFLNYSEQGGALVEPDEEKTGFIAGMVDIKYFRNVDGDDSCDTLLGDYNDIYSFAWYLHKTLTFIKYLGPTLVVLFSGIDYIKALVASDADAMKKTNSKLFKRIACCLLLFFVPLVLDLLFDVFKLYGACHL